ncbi:MAG: carbohydrate ABC transporter permease [Halanaerobiales bacterium]|nr:carbohydrate ABC transporter permease [Halanaerobiales bacterium]
MLKLFKSIKVYKMQALGLGLLRWVLIGGICYIIIFPVLSKLSSSFMTIPDIFDKTVMWIPRNLTLDNYRFAFAEMEYPQAFINTLVLTLTISIFQLLACTLIGYGFGRFNFWGKQLFFALVIFTLIVPPQMIMIPLYLNFKNFNPLGLLPGGGINLLGSFWPFILTALSGTGLRNGLFIYIMRQFFKGMSRSLEEAAYVDGAGPLRTFFQIMLPGATPALIIVFLFSFVWQWNDYFFTNIFMGSGSQLLPIMLNDLIYQIDPSLRTTAYASIINNTGSLLFMAPLLLLYAVLQRYFVESIERTGLVG